MSTIRDVAREAGVSVSTVSLAFNSPERVSPETRERIARAAASVDYQSPDPVAQTLSSGRSQLIGMVQADISNAFFGKLLREVELHAHARGYLVIVSDSNAEHEREEKILRHMSSMRVAGMIVSPCGLNEAETAHLHDLKTPFILFDQKHEGLSCDFVGTDNQLASATLTDHLIQLGHRRIGFLGGVEGLYTARERERGFVDRMQASGLEIDSELMVDARYTYEASYAQSRRLLTMQRPPTALLACSNVMSLAALQAIRDLGLECPGDISLTGIDDVPWMHMISPQITVVVQPVEAMAQTTARLILERIEQRQNGSNTAAEFTDNIFPPVLKIGDSSASLNET
ncbi:LacI family DNA-binding transcriptional regulator [Granulosicoccus sp. 3-233]|uniref:LacI family DNA-binding transcriptional regulator n=1 Tax=Granulosicoccus sp. 3-233 TaxID=3417969 RepID=UPI003D33CBDB